MAQYIMGQQQANKTNDLVFKNQTGAMGGMEQLESATADPVNLNAADKVASHMLTAQATDGKQELRDAVQGDDPSAPVGQAYGTAMANNSLDATANKLGVNKHARAHIGEAYVTSSVSQGGADHLKDFSKPDIAGQPATRDFIWGYHYAAVIAEALAGDDHMLLENYNRNSEPVELLEELKTANYANFQAAMTGKDYSTIGNPRNKAKAMLADVLENAGTARDQAETQAAAILQAYMQKAMNLWYFRMVGTGLNQSFHETQANSGYFVNPLTMVVRPSRKVKVEKIYFNRSSAVIDTPSRGRISLPGTVGQMVADLTRYPGIKLKITGYANKKMFGRSNTDLALNRANAVKTFLITLPALTPFAARIETINGGDDTAFPAEVGKTAVEASRRAEIKTDD
jgi:outer membrane protein OmpA-like peptidoglycan-associated protein